MAKNDIIKAPVVYNFFIRPDISKRVFEAIREAKPNKLYLVSDGPRNEAEKKVVIENRRTLELMVDWPTNLSKIYLDDNIGIDNIMELTFERVFEKEDRMIFLEEDIYPSQSFFGYCDELLEKYIDDERIFLIGGINWLGEYPNYSTKNPSYFFVNGCSTWGMATWRRTYLKIQKDLTILDNHYYDNAIKELMKIRNSLIDYKKVRLIKDSPETVFTKGELFLMGFNQNILFNSLAIVPQRNLILNLGNSEGAEHSDATKLLPHSMREFEKMILHELEFPLIHPDFLIVDHVYSKLYLNLNPPKNFLFNILIKFERALRILLFGGPGRFWIKFKKAISRYWNIDRKLKKYK